MYCYTAKAQLRIEDRLYNVVPGDLSLIQPDTPHEYRVDEENPADAYWCHFDFIPEHLHMSNAGEAEVCFKNILSAYLSGSSYWQLTAKVYFYQLIGLIYRERVREDLSSAKVAREVNDMKGYIAQHYFDKIQVKDITPVTIYNHEYASKLFRQEVGMTINEYLNRYRIGQAKRSCSIMTSRSVTLRT